MTQAASDRNLLFGILALQMDLISRDALIAAMNDWVLQKDRSLGEILEARGDLSASDRALLEPLVRRHVEQHGDDPARSLASISSVEWIREALSAVGRADPDVTTSLGHLRLASTESLADAEATAPHATRVDAPEGRFRILRFHAKGGLGEVFVAEDVELHRQVALKRIQDRHDEQPESRARFLLEAEVTGGLEHPGIVPVYGLGHYDDGRPFYAMRFIKGDSLKEAIERFHCGDSPGQSAGERVLGLQKLLRRFLDVCNAIAYAHSRGVLHRDIKPGNIMVGQYGETLVVDWGLAKVVGTHEPTSEATLRPPSASGTGDTMPGSAIGTPAFMSPEQAEGRIDRLGPASDVYSLGATLYSLLTGRTPIEGGDLDDVLRRVRAGDVQPPRQVVPEVSPALEAICLKAMAREPEGRYPSPRALAEDIERWLADEPVAAYPEPWTGRAARWARRHQARVASAVAAVAVAAVCLGAAAALLAAANERERKLAELARREGQAARANFRMAFDAVDRSFTQVSESQLVNVPGLQPLRRQLLDTSRDFFQKFLDQGRDDPTVQAELARTYLRLADIAFATDAAPRAVELAREGQGRFATLERSDPANLDYAKEVARATASLATMHTWLRDLDLAEAEYLEAIRRYEGLVAKRPGNTSFLGGLARARGDLGMAYVTADRPAEARPVLLAARESARALVASQPDSPDAWDVLQQVEHNVSRYFVQVGDLAAAESAARAAVDAAERLIRDRPEDLRRQHLRATLLLGRGEIEYDLGRTDDAERSFREAVNTLDRLVRENPTVVPYRRSLVQARVRWGSICRDTGRRDQAQAHHDAALRLAEDLAREHPDVPEIQNELAVVLSALFSDHYGTGRMEQAEAVNRRAAEIRRKLAEQHARDSHFQDVQSQSRANQALAAGGRADETLEGLQETIVARRRLVAEHPEIVKYRYLLAHALNTLGGRAFRAQRWDQTEAAFRDSIAAWREVVRMEPDAPYVRFELARTLSNLAGLFVVRRGFGRAAPLLQEAIEILERLVREHPAFVEYPEALSAAYDMRGSVARETFHHAEAARGFEQAIRTLEEVLRRDPQNHRARHFLITSHDNHAVLLIQRGDHRAAVRELEPLTGDPARRPDQVYNLGCAFALAGASAAADPQLPKAERDALAEGHWTRAVKLLGEYAASGLLGPEALLAQIKGDTDLASLRRRADYQGLVQRLESQAAPLGKIPPKSDTPSPGR